MRRFKILVLLSALTLVFSGCIKKSFSALNERSERKNFEAYGPMEDYGADCEYEELDIAYAPGESDADFLTLDVYWNDHDEVVPVVVNIHGGAWEVGDKSALNSMFRSKYMANHGYVAVNVNYRMLPHYAVKTQVEDVMGAVIWVKEHAAEYGADPERVGVMGGSAGGHLTAMVAWASDDPFFSPTGQADSIYDSDVLAAVPFYGVFDFEDMMQVYGDRLSNVGFKYFLKEKKGPERDELIRHVSPRYHIDGEAPPTFFICGDQDSFKLYPDSVNSRDALMSHGVPTGLYTATGADHGFDNHYGETYTKEAMEAALEWFDKYLK